MMMQAHSFQRYLPICPPKFSCSFSILFLIFNFNLNWLVCSPSSKLWQLLFMERSALLSDPSAYESDQSHLQAAAASDAVEEELEGPSVDPAGGTEPLEPEPERPSRPPSQGRRPSRAPAVEGSVEMPNCPSLILIVYSVTLLPLSTHSLLATFHGFAPCQRVQAVIADGFYFSWTSSHLRGNDHWFCNVI